MKIVVHGVQMGIVLAFLIGPVFFTILQTSIEKGFWKGALVAVGVSISDILCVVICYFGLVHFFENPQFKADLAYVGGAILILFGLYYLLVKSRRMREANALGVERKNYRYVMKGFIINGMTPMVLIFWIGAISVASLDFGYTRGYEFVVFFAAVLATVLGTDVLKAYLAGKLRRLITQRVLMIMNVVLGLVMMGFGVRLIFLAKTL